MKNKEEMKELYDCLKTDEKIYKEMFKVFCRLHPSEAYELDSLMFCELMREEGYNLTNNEIEELIKEE